MSGYRTSAESFANCLGYNPWRNRQKRSELWEATLHRIAIIEHHEY